MATKAELEERIDILERRMAVVERVLKSLTRAVDGPAPTADERDRARLSPILKILRRHGGEATLDIIWREHPDHITRPGVRAQLIRLVELGDVENPERGLYAVTRRS